MARPDVLKTVRRAIALLRPHDRRQLPLVTFIALVAAALETLSVALIFPFLAVAMNPGIIESDPLIGPLQDVTGLHDLRQFQLFLASMALVAVVVANAAGAFAKWWQARFIWNVKADLSARLFSNYLSRPYALFLNDNSSRAVENSLSQSFRAGDAIINSSVTLIRAITTGAGILLLLGITRPLTTLAVFGFLGLAYGALYMAVRARLHLHGTALVNVSRARLRAATETFAGIKEVRLYGVENVQAKRFATSSAQAARHSGLMGLLGILPFHVMQVVAFGGLMTVFIILLSGSDTLDSIIPTMGFFAFAGYRLLPALQEGFQAASMLRGGTSAIDAIEEDALQSTARVPKSDNRLPLTQALEARGLRFKYPGAELHALHGIDITIASGSTVAFVGPSGSGKTTLLDILTGLLSPTDGQLLVDGNSLKPEQLQAWRRNIGYVPQEVTLLDASIGENIAFGAAASDIDDDAVMAAVKAAHLDDVVARLPEGLDTMVGERGVRLSGGQRQRIGIARALYRNPDVILFDEATSNLDSVSEAAISSAIAGLHGVKTIIIVAHRITTIQGVDEIHVLEEGRIVSQGTYEELLTSDPHFRALAMVDGD